MLHGGGRGLNDDVRREFVRLAGGKAARIVLIPSDMAQRGKDDDGRPRAGGETIAAYERRLSRPEQYGRWTALRDTGHIASVRFLYCDQEQDDARLAEALKDATGVWIPAYDQAWVARQFTSRDATKPGRFQAALRDVVARGGVVGALGGGMAALPETMIVQDAIAKTGWVRAELGFGLGLLSGVVADQNFQSHAGRLERLTDLLRNGPRLNRLASVPGVERRTIGLGVERHTVLILSGSTIRALGEGRGHVFLKSNGDRTITWRTVTAGDDPLVVQSSLDRRAPAHSLAIETESAWPNPFGLPEPLDKSRPGTVVLHGGGSTDEIIELLPALAGVSKPRLVHCPAARESCRPKPGTTAVALAEHLEKTFEPWRSLQLCGRLEDLAFVTTSSAADANRPEFVAPLRRAQAAWFCGGDQRPLAELFVDPLAPTLFQQEVLKIVRRGGVVGGSSAGLAIMADVMIEGGESKDGRPAEASLSRGLGVLQHVLAEQHFDAVQGRIERLTGLLCDHRRLANFSPTCEPKKMLALAVEEDTALLVQGNRLRVTGRKQAHAFLQTGDSRTIVWHALESGDAARVWAAAEGLRLELDDWAFQED